MMNEKKQSSLLPPDLPLLAEQEQWLAGFLAGLKQGYGTLRANFQEASGLKPLYILYGSQTGNAEGLAYLCAELSKTHGMVGEVKDMSDLSAADLSQMERLIIITSTYGEGEMPDNAQSLWEEVISADAPNLQGVFFAVLAIGDSGYDDFCEAGKKWDARLAQLGAVRIAERIDCDVDFESSAQTWLENTLSVITEKGSQEASSSKGDNPSPTSSTRPASQYNRNNPLKAKLKRKQCLSGAGSGKQIFHYEIDLGESGEHYDAGDVVHIFPLNRPELVAELIATIGAKGEEIVSWQGENLPLEKVLTEKAEIRTPARDFYAAFLAAANDADLNNRFESPDRREWDKFAYGKDIVDYLRAFPAATFTAQTLVDVLKPLSARAYSISSSIRQNPAEVHITVGAVRYHSDGRDHHGVASTWLADFVNEGDEVACYFAVNKHFSIPEKGDTPMIMVGPGTGIAPFRAFLQERAALKAKGENWLFFGDRTRKDDFIYEEELTAMQNSGLLTRLDLAFSREQAEKIYVQDKMREHGAELFAWLERGAHFYVCGDALRMAKDVDLALHEIIATHGKIDSKAAEDYVNALKKAKRYVRDVY